MIVAVPGATPVTLPEVTVATEELLLDQVTCLFVVSEGVNVTVRLSVEPASTLSVLDESSIAVAFTGVPSVKVPPSVTSAPLAS